MTETTLNQRIVVWARARLGQRVGRRGECWDLAEQALSNSGALTSRDQGDVGRGSNYVWGTAKEVSRIQAGDILQIRDYERTTVTETTVEWSDGTAEIAQNTETASHPHHTAIVNGSPDRVGQVAIFDQNTPPGGRVVQSRRLYTQSVPVTTTTTHENRRHPDTNNLTPATITTRITVTVTGRIWAYAPIARPAASEDSDE